ncbi:GNAT family N-acetyltransferase [Cryomorpha ignava]|uniref:GNAT family N-acetyltransferase n=1 Tax=Cryomorpha ignava TaxID=101383 RepID=A0A7K3WRQ8_9FLAO|nr:GNAT family N-acetyltransferase [Cryomorpha ignava]NEN24360.1 GNAT family N-acetyltransferase [Cryomorpha ignava]
MNTFHIAEISAEETFPLRSLVLRSRDSSIPCPFEGDKEKTTHHFGYVRENEIVAIASFYQRKSDLLGQKEMVQLRGMATHPDYSGQGCGKELMEFTIDFYRDNGFDLIWCNAREIAFGFYQKLGFLSKGENFLIPEIGVHRVMYYAFE